MVAYVDVVKRDDRRRERSRRRRNLDWQDLGRHQCRRGLEPGKHFEPRLRLARFARLGTEAVDEGLHMTPLRRLLLGQLDVELQALAPLAFETRIAAAVECELAGFEMQDPVDR